MWKKKISWSLVGAIPCTLRNQPTSSLSYFSYAELDYLLGLVILVKIYINKEFDLSVLKFSVTQYHDSLYCAAKLALGKVIAEIGCE
jgi:hypothetical protein